MARSKHGATFLDRLWAQIDRDGPVPAHAPHLGPCHLWTGTLNDDGYGVLFDGTSMRRVHRVVWELTEGPIPPRIVVRHKCDVRPCVRHLCLGTQAQNVADTKKRGRTAAGERNGSARLTQDIVADIRRRYGPRGSGRALAQEYGVSTALVSLIVNRKAWT